MRSKLRHGRSRRNIKYRGGKFKFNGNNSSNKLKQKKNTTERANYYYYDDGCNCAFVNIIPKCVNSHLNKNAKDERSLY